MKSILIQDEVYYRQTLVILGNDIEFAKKSFKDAFNDDASSYITDFYNEDSTSRGRTIHKNGVCVILLRDFDQGSLAHEVFHATEFHFDHIGLPHSDTSSEAWAYYIQFLFSKIYNEFTKD